MTVAERPLDPADFPGAPPENLVPGSMVFTPHARARSTCATSASGGPGRPGACWRHPEGPGARVDEPRDHPVVHVAHEDAAAYAAWAGRDAADRGASGSTPPAAASTAPTYTWGDEPEPPRRASWPTTGTGDFPWRARATATARTAPVGCFPPNGYGLFDMAGNVWEWTDDWYDRAPPGRRRHAVLRAREPARRRRRGQLRPRAAAVPGPAQGHQGRLVPVRRHLLPALPARRPAAADDRHRHEPRRLPLRRDRAGPRTAEVPDHDRTTCSPPGGPGATRDARRGVPRRRAVDVPAEERVACFDNDGTLWCERPSYVQFDFFVDALQAAGRRTPTSVGRPEFARPAGRRPRPRWASSGSNGSPWP